MQQALKQYHIEQYGHEGGLGQPHVPERTSLASNVYVCYALSYNTGW